MMGAKAGPQSPAPPHGATGSADDLGSRGRREHLFGRGTSDRTTNRSPRVLRVPGRRSGRPPRLRLATGLAPVDPERARPRDDPAAPHHDELDDARDPSPASRP